MHNNTYTAFAGDTILVSGSISEVLQEAKLYIDKGEDKRLAIFDDESGYIIDFDFRGTIEAVLARLPDHPMMSHLKGKGEKIKRGRGRPRLGVVSKEVTLLPDQWEWLSQQHGGASVTLRKLVHDARKKTEEKANIEKVKDAVQRFMWDIASNLENYEELTRAFYAGDYSKCLILLDPWPADIKAYVTVKLMRIVELEKV